MTKSKLIQATLLIAALALPRTLLAGTQVQFETTAGTITIELEDEKAPLSVANFLDYIASDFYVDTFFHRVIPGFVIQGGGFTADMQKKKTQEPVKNEANNGLKNTHYSLSMARTSVPDSATSQFFININDNAFLDHTAETADGWGYAVFGRVTEGKDIVDAIAKSETTSKAGMRDVPANPITVTATTVLSP